ncbi:unnamed protein product [Orchesella dallaii]|uniref:Ionotropic glutamate receptor C-terminal domain-containing protein n=1 Tax=Orchesella dallaii TaxID=48710 RepID=A0ABP1R5Y9_9HEXA
MTFICNEYCRELPTPCKNLNFAVQNLLKFHHSLFKNANSKLIPSMTGDMFGNLAKGEKYHPKHCLRHKAIISSRCRTEAMSILTINQVHNITLNMSLLTMTNIMKYQVTDVHTPIEHIVFAVNFQAPGFPRPFTQQLHFNKYDTTSLLYCEKRGKIKGILMRVKVWYEPFTPGIWLGFLAILFITALLHWLEFQKNDRTIVILKIASIVFGQGSLERKRYFIIACGITYLCLLYENSLLSLVTIVPQPKSIKTLRELLDSGFKIMWPANMPPTHSPSFLYGWDFNISKLQDRIHDAFFEVKSTARMIDWVAEITKNSQKLAVSQSTPGAKMALNDLTQHLRVQDDTYSCFQVKQVLSPKMHHWKINTENRYWILRTVERIVESGLYFQWDLWSTWHYVLTLRQFNNPNGARLNPNYINLARTLPVMFTWSALLVIGIVVFCIELRNCNQKRKTSTNLAIPVPDAFDAK